MKIKEWDDHKFHFFWVEIQLTVCCPRQLPAKQNRPGGPRRKRPGRRGLGVGGGGEQVHATRGRRRGVGAPRRVAEAQRGVGGGRLGPRPRADVFPSRPVVGGGVRRVVGLHRRVGRNVGRSHALRGGEEVRLKGRRAVRQEGGEAN